jgi:hypothetical protein
MCRSYTSSPPCRLHCGRGTSLITLKKMQVEGIVMSVLQRGNKKIYERLRNCYSTASQSKSVESIELWNTQRSGDYPLRNSVFSDLLFLDLSTKMHLSFLLCLLHVSTSHYPWLDRVNNTCWWSQTKMFSLYIFLDSCVTYYLSHTNILVKTLLLNFLNMQLLCNKVFITIVTQLIIFIKQRYYKSVCVCSCYTINLPWLVKYNGSLLCSCWSVIANA